MRKLFAVLFTTGLLCSLTVVSFAQSSDTKTPVIRQRQKIQQKRIGQGVRSGELTRRETVRLEKEQHAINHQKKAAKADGEVTKRERARIHHEQNQASQHIHRAKHNNRSRP